ncbi:hypothetical protein [Bacillus sp. FJAT-29937]|uniref:hypothetical protein n=1 Tax=Bacillus sp. FJAT-29937 TaxID=1720553 RepID=UPI00082CD9A3|nr:hypothetical protein [Bacillus sp. FJAT-29937]
MKLITVVFIFTILPGVLTILSYFIPSLAYPLKIIVPLSITVLYFIGLAIFLQIKLNKEQSNSGTLNYELDKLNHEKVRLDNKIVNYDKFVHKRELFINHDLVELGTLITEYEGYVKNSYRGQKHQEMRDEAGSVKKRTIEIINKEKREFDEQLYNVQSYKDN